MANAPKGYVYVGHYYSTDGEKMIKVGTTNNLERRQKEHTRNYRKAKKHTMPATDQFVYDAFFKVSIYAMERYEDITRELWKELGIGDFVRNDRFSCENVEFELPVPIKTTYTVVV